VVREGRSGTEGEGREGERREGTKKRKEGVEVERLYAKFHLNVFTVSASGGQKHNFGQFLIFGGLLYPPPFTDEGQIWCARAEPRSTVTDQISSECVHCVGFRWPKTTILGKFSLSGVSCKDPLSPMRAKCGVL